MNRLNLLAALIAVPCLFAGCNTMPPTAVKPDPLPLVSYPQIATEGTLGDHMFYTRPIVRMEPGTPMKVTVPLRLRDDKPVNAQYRFTFMDADGAPLSPPMDWRFMVLPPRLQVFMEGTAMSGAARDWRLEVRPAK
jgi:uncharacterized protein YcfL